MTGIAGMTGMAGILSFSYFSFLPIVLFIIIMNNFMTNECFIAVLKKTFFALSVICGLVLVLGAAAPISAANLASQLKGRILLQVESHGEAYYVSPNNLKRYYLGRPDDSFLVMRNLGLGAKHSFIANNVVFPASVRGKILLDVESHGEAYYIYPVDGKKYYLGRPADAFQIMRRLGLGISNANLGAMPDLVYYKNESGSSNDAAASISLDFLGEYEVNCGAVDCFTAKFRACVPQAKLSLKMVGANLKIAYQIKEKKNGQCLIESYYPENPSPAWINKKMVCAFDQSKDFNSAVTEVFDNSAAKCTGDLVALLNPTY
jgi:hypothetical protein